MIVNNKPRQWKPNATVAAIIERDGRFLMVEEETPAGLRLNQPAGHLERGETLLQAVAREALEESGWLFAPRGLTGIYLADAQDGDVTYMRFAFHGDATPPAARRDWTPASSPCTGCPSKTSPPSKRGFAAPWYRNACKTISMASRILCN
ncbi:Phosphatase nudJ [Chromobacterium violaceum]|uniref:Phosphatase nudJ n=1 Tax=Chromobacterium violaceum TaxID=536 RepID=A0A447THS8_CHRVL|nr:Phosphatase nudJ [Chromobacterium violaceum]